MNMEDIDLNSLLGNECLLVNWGLRPKLGSISPLYIIAKPRLEVVRGNSQVNLGNKYEYSAVNDAYPDGLV